ncbi:hypothetical protein FOC1_h10016690, partial [Fusarium oxysporum f. sp. cubense race 1]
NNKVSSYCIYSMALGIILYHSLTSRLCQARPRRNYIDQYPFLFSSVCFSSWYKLCAA